MREHTNRGIFRRYAILLSLTVSLLVCVAGLALILVTFRSNEKQISEVQSLQSRLIQARVSTLFDGVERQMKFVGAIPWDSPALSLDDRIVEFRQALALFPALIDIRLIGNGGVELLAVGRNEPVRIKSERLDEAQIALKASQSRSLEFSPVSYETGRLQPFVSIALSDKSGSSLVTVARVSLQSLSEELALLARSHGGEAFIVDREGLMVAHSDRTKILRPTSLRQDAAVQASGLLLAPSAGTSAAQTGKASIERNGVSIFTTWVDMGRARWSLFLEREHDKVFEPVHRAVALALGLLALGIVSSLGVSYVLARRMSRPMVELSRSARRLASGDLAHRVAIGNTREITEVASSFNFMAAELEDLTKGLEQRITVATHQLAEEFDLRAEKTREIVKLEERARIMRDFHDGVGGHLVGLLGVIRHGQFDNRQVANMVQDALVDFRIAIDSLSPSEPDLVTAVANLRHRLGPRLQVTTLDSRWSISELPSEVLFSQEKIFHIQRIIVEAVTNAIKHATDASFLHVSLAWDARENRVRLQIEDDGQTGGIDEAALDSGAGVARGLGNIRSRAKLIGAQLAFRRGANERGTLVEVLIPVEKPSAQ